MKRLVVVLFLIATACGDLHILRWDYIPGAGWRSHQPGIECMIDCFDGEGNVRPACQGCFDANKRLIPGCTPGHYDVSDRKAAIDAKIKDKITEDHCRLTAYGCHCTGLAYPWTAAQKKVYPPCDPRQPKGVKP